MNATKKAYGLDEWCELSGISRGTVYNLEKAGKIKISKVRSRSLILAEEDERFWRELEAEGSTQFRALSEKRQRAKQKTTATKELASSAARRKTQ